LEPGERDAFPALFFGEKRRAYAEITEDTEFAEKRREEKRREEGFLTSRTPFGMTGVGRWGRID